MSDEKTWYGNTTQGADPYDAIVAHLDEIKEQVKEFEGAQTGPFIVIELRNVVAKLDDVVTEIRENNRALYAITRAIRRQGGMNATEEKEFIDQAGAGIAANTEGIINAQKEDTTT